MPKWMETETVRTEGGGGGGGAIERVAHSSHREHSSQRMNLTEFVCVCVLTLGQRDYAMQIFCRGEEEFEREREREREQNCKAKSRPKF